MANEFRTINYEGQRADGNGYIQAGDPSQALQSNAAYMGRQLERAGGQVQAQNALSLSQNRQIDQIAIDNQRLINAQMSDRNQTVLKGQQMLGEQRLRNREMRQGWQESIGRLKASQQASSEEMKIRLSAQENEALTELGANLVQFSTTLWKSKAEKINQQNQEIQAQGMLDEITGLGKTQPADVMRVDQSQQARLAAQGQTMLVAKQEENAGRQAEANRLRADNPFYLYGRQEGAALKASYEIGTTINQAIEEAINNGKLNPLNPQSDVLVQEIIQRTSRQFIIDSGLIGAPPAIVAKYLSTPLLKAQAQATAEWNAKAGKGIDQARQALAKNTIITAWPAISADPNEGRKVLDQLVNAFDGDIDKATEAAFSVAAANSRSTLDRAGLDNLMLDPRMGLVAEKYQAFETQWQQQAVQNAEKAAEEQSMNLQRGLLEQLQTASPGQVPALKESYLEAGQFLPAKEYIKYAQWVRGLSPADAVSAQNSLDMVVENSKSEDISANMNRWIEQNPTAGATMIAKAQKLKEQFAPAMSDTAKLAVQAKKAEILGTIPPLIKAKMANDQAYQMKVNEVIKLREAMLDIRAKAYWAKPGASEAGFIEWLQNNHADLTKRAIEEVNGRFPDLELLAKPAPPSAAVAPLPRLKTASGATAVFYVNQDARKRVLAGQYGRLNVYQSVLLTKTELRGAIDKYEDGEDVGPLVKKLADAAGTNVETLMQVNAQLYGIPGRLVRPADPRATPAYQRATNNGSVVTKQYAIDFARSQNFSPRGAVWLATNMMDESGGVSTKTHDSGTGLGLFGHRLGRREALRAFAASKGVPDTDAHTQLEFAVQEIKTKYPDVWKVVSAPNPTTRELWWASRTWEGFDETVYAQREASLLRSLGEL